MKKGTQEVPFLLSAVLSVYAWICAVFFTVLLFLTAFIFVSPFCLMIPRYRNRSLIHAVSQFWARSIIYVSPLWRYRVEGLANIKPGKHYLVIANHQSLLDILVVLASLPLHFKFLAKKELFSIPFIGWHMSLSGYIPIDRARHESGRSAILSARRWLDKGVSLVFFPEGTRSTNGAIHAFKMGAFKIAAEGDVEILPVVIDGTGDAVPKKSWNLKKKTIFVVSIGKPVSISSKKIEALEALRDKMREEMIGRLARIREERHAG